MFAATIRSNRPRKRTHRWRGASTRRACRHLLQQRRPAFEPGSDMKLLVSTSCQSYASVSQGVSRLALVRARRFRVPADLSDIDVLVASALPSTTTSVAARTK